MRIYLVGYMGSGKSTLGSQLAERLGFQFIDLDEYIQRMTGFSITEIFRSQGEEYFRKTEADLLRRITEDDVVVATGGGCPVHHQNMDWINANGTSVYLKMKPQTAFERLKDARSDRPLLKGLSEKNLLLWIKDQMEQREEFYAQANHILEDEKAEVERLAGLLQSK